MRLLGVSEARGRSAHDGRKVARALCALFSLLFVSQVWARGTPAGTQIRAWAQVSYEDANAISYTVTSDTVLVTVGQVAGTDLEPPRSSITDPGASVAFYHSLVNVGNGTDSFLVSASSRKGWPVRVYLDANGDGGLDAGDPEVSGPLTLAADDTAWLLVVVDVPGLATLRGTTDTVDVQAASSFDGSASDQIQDLVEIRDVGIVINLSMSVDRATATLGDVLTYPITYSASGPNSATNFEVSDPVPSGTSYVPGTLRLNGAPLTDAAGDDTGYFDAGANRVVFRIGDIAGGDNGTVSFQVRIESLQTGTAANSASGSYETFAGRDSLISNSVETTLIAPQLLLEKTLVGPSIARIGDEVRYTLRYGNTSTVTARDVVISDTLPAGFEFVSSQPAAAVSDSILTWSFGDLAPGDTAEISLTVRVSDTVRDTLEVSNVAFLNALNSAGAEMAQAEAVQLIGIEPDQLALDKVADVLEVGLGETAPYTLTLENTGLVPLTDLRIHDRLPAGGRYSNGSLIGADSVRANGRDLTIFVAGPLAPGATRSVRYSVAIISAAERTLANTAYATAEGELVRSQDVTAWIRVRKGWPMETRAAIGKVWVDLDGDGVQEPGERGVEGIDIWTEDGEVASSDSEGKFSYRNIRPGRHAYRLDPMTVPVAYRVVESGTAGDLLIKDSDGWTTPRINFRLLPREATLERARLPVSWSFQARPLPGPDLREICGEAMADEARTLFFETNSARPPIDTAFIRRVAQALAQGPECWLEVAGHADSRPIHGGPYQDNWELSRARAESVAYRLIDLGFESPKVLVRGYGDTRPLATGEDSLSYQLNRRVELRLVAPPYWSAQDGPVVEYEAVIDNDYDVALSGLRIRFQPEVDSAVALVDSSVVALAGRPVALPTIAPHSRLTVRGWTRAGPDSALAALESGDGISASGLLAAIHNPLMPADGVSEALVVVDRLPDPAAVPTGAAVEIMLAPAAAGWPDVAFPLPEGWAYVDGSARASGHPAPDPEARRDRDGAPWLFWRLSDSPLGPLSLKLRPAGVREPVGAVSVPALRTSEERQAERGRAFVAGPAVEVFEPRDGAVLPSDRVYVGVRGEPGTPVALFDGDSLIAEATLRIDGLHDFIAIPLSRGPHRLRVRMKNSWQQERWDSLAVHVTGLPAQIVTQDRPSLVADGHSVTTIRARVLDRWGVPVVNATYVTISAQGAEPLGADVDPSSVGLQLATDEAGWLKVAVRPGRDVGKGTLVLSAGDAKSEIELELLPAIRPLMVTGVGRIGLGAAPDAFGSITARGRLDERTSVMLSYDSRRLDAGRDFFGRGYDPLEEAQYPLLGDASQTRSMSASDNAFSARLERGFDWLALGHITTSDFTSGLTLTAYDRALPGAAARISTGPVVWKGFGSSTTQSLRQLQIRGVGTSGPYQLEPNIRPGTDRVVIETRARENAARVISSQSLARYIDYQIDYVNGTLLFKRPVPAADIYENPVFIVVTFEAESGGERQAVWGVRASADARNLISSQTIDSLRVGATYISDGQSAGEHRLAGADLRVVGYGALDVGAELSYAQSPDSSGFATAIDGSVRLLDGDLTLSAVWMRVGNEYHNPSNLNLRGGTEEVRAAGGLKIGTGELRLEHELQTFQSEDVKRRRTSAGIVQSLGSDLQLDARVTADRFVNGDGGGADESQAGELKLSWAPTQRFKLWTEARRQFNYSGNVVLPDYFGGGAAFQIMPNVSLETQHRVVLPRDDSTSYSVSSLGIRTDLGLGTQAWGSYQIASGVSGQQNAAIIGLNNRFRFGDWSFNTLFERRFGLDNASVADPVRALPFLRSEEDYWSTGFGVEYLPAEAPYRMAARGEYRDGDLRSSKVLTLAGDVSLNRSLAVLSRSEYLWTEQTLVSGSAISERTSTLWGLAFRPVGNDALNVLSKLEWLEEKDPIGGGVLGANGDERRVIGALEAIWAPFSRGELAGRYAIRRTDAERLVENDETQSLTSWADYLGGRFDIGIRRWLAFRGESRLLIERTSDSRRWDAAPSLVFIPIDGFEAQLGYRFGDLRDPDFAVNGGPGLFAVVGIRITERVYPTSADFWRRRFGQQ
jgi:uncharacterized repeat protein (TIGR01451 family)